MWHPSLEDFGLIRGALRHEDNLQHSRGRSIHPWRDRKPARQEIETCGAYRETELNIGRDPKEILQRIPQLLANTQHWLDNKTSPTDEALLRFHHQLTKIHPFANGNGRHARLIADIVAVKYGQSEFTWGAGKDLVAEGDARTRYLAALRALDANENDVKPLLDFARS